MTRRVKICGLTRPEDAELAARLGATHVGCVLEPGTRRFVEPARARDVLAAGKPAAGVLVYRRPSYDDVRRAAETTGVIRVQLDAVQVDVAMALVRAGFHVLRTYIVTHELPRPNPIPTEDRPVVFDTGGGTGRTFAWSLLGDRAPAATFVAGGVRPDNVRALLRHAPWGIDVSSGVESAPGVKCPDLLARLLAEVAEVRA
jgi:phosphoribosylanthranilate isomerase